jgi:hypothetical protein
MIKKISSQQLIKGMYVCGTDRKWLDTPFLWSKFLIKSDAQIQEIQEYCHFVLIDTQKGSDLPDEANPVTSIKLNPAEIIYQQTLRAYSELCDTAATEQILDSGRLNQMVQGLFEGLNRFPEHMLSLSLQTMPENGLVHRAINICIQVLVLAKHLKLEVERIHALGQGALLSAVGESISDKEHTENPESCRLVWILNNLNRADELIRNRQQAYKLEFKLNNLFQAVLVLVFEFNKLQGKDGRSIYQSIEQMSIHHDELDTDILAHFMAATGLYPLNSLVELNTGALGFVVDVNSQRPKQPTLKIMTDIHKQLLAEPVILNLADPLQSQYAVKNVLAIDEPVLAVLLDYLA